MMQFWCRMEYVRRIHTRYHHATRKEKGQILDEFCQVCGYHRKYAIRLLNAPLPEQESTRRPRTPHYSPTAIAILEAIWEASGYLWSQRLKAALPLWLPWARKRLPLTPELEAQLLAISPATIDRRLRAKKRQLKKRRYGSTRPGTLLKHQIPIKTDAWDVHTPGFLEVDLVAHGGSSMEGEFLYTLDCTDMDTTWTERRAVMGRGQQRVVDAFEEIREHLPFPLRGIDSDNDSGFINYHLKAFCERYHVQFTRSRPYKKDDNAHIEQKNWTHVRKIFGYVRYDSHEALEAMNDLYRNELRWFQNAFQPSVKLLRKERVGAKLKRLYGPPQTPLQRVGASPAVHADRVAALQQLFESLDPFILSERIDEKVDRIYRMASTPERRPTSIRRSAHRSSRALEPEAVSLSGYIPK